MGVGRPAASGPALMFVAALDADMTDYEMHEPDCSGTIDADWEVPRSNDLDISERSSDDTRKSQSGSRDADDLSEVDDHFVLSGSGFPPENFTDLQASVVDPDGTLDLNALQTAHDGGHSVEAMDDVDDDDTAADVEESLETLARREFDRDLGAES